MTVIAPTATIEWAHALHGEALLVRERLVVAPADGRYRATAPDTYTAEGELVFAGGAVGVVMRSGEELPCTSNFTGYLMEVMVVDGERVRAGQPVAWLRLVSADA